MTCTSLMDSDGVSIQKLLNWSISLEKTHLRSSHTGMARRKT